VAQLVLYHFRARDSVTHLQQLPASPSNHTDIMKYLTAIAAAMCLAGTVLAQDAQFTLKTLQLGVTADQFAQLFPAEARPADYKEAPRCATEGSPKKAGYDSVCFYRPYDSGPFRDIQPAAPDNLLSLGEVPVDLWEADFVDGKAVAISAILHPYLKKSSVEVEYPKLVSGLTKRYGPPTKSRGGLAWQDAKGDTLIAWSFDPWKQRPQDSVRFIRVRVEMAGFIDREHTLARDASRAKRDATAKAVAGDL
jgi:hypothetical protein